MPRMKEQHFARRAFHDAESGQYVAGPLSDATKKAIGKSRLAKLVDQGKVEVRSVAVTLTDAEAERAGLSTAERSAMDGVDASGTTDLADAGTRKAKRAAGKKSGKSAGRTAASAASSSASE